MDALAYSKDREEFLANRAVVHFLDHLTEDLKDEMTQYRIQLASASEAPKPGQNPYMESDSTAASEAMESLLASAE